MAPECQRTPRIEWPDPDPVEKSKEAKAWAGNEPKVLGQFYAGRVLLRNKSWNDTGSLEKTPKEEYEELWEKYHNRKQ